MYVATVETLPLMGKIADALALILACTTANDAGQLQSVRATETCKFPMAPMGFSHVLRLCLQGGGVYVQSGSVTFSSCTINGNTATSGVRAHVRKFPSPDGKMADVLAPTHALHNWECFGQLQGVRAAATFKSSHRPDGKLPC